MAQISTLWVPPCSRAGPSARSRARAKFQGKEGRPGRGTRAQLGGKIQQLLCGGYVLLGKLVGTAAGWDTLAWVCISASRQVPCPVEQPPSLRGEGARKGQCEVVRGKRQQLDELEFLSGRGAGGGRSWQALARAADHR